MSIERSQITGANGRHVQVSRAGLGPRHVIPAVWPEATAVVQLAAPRNGRELATRLDALSSQVRRIPPPGGEHPTAFHQAKAEIAAELQRLAECVGRLGTVAAVRVAMPRNGHELAARFDALSSKVRRIPPPGRENPSAFHEAKAEIAAELLRLAIWAGRLG